MPKWNFWNPVAKFGHPCSWKSSLSWPGQHWIASAWGRASSVKNKDLYIYSDILYAPSPQRLLLCCQQQPRAPSSRPPPCSTCPWPPPSATWAQPGGQAPPREPPAGPRRPGCHVQPSCAVMNNHKVVSKFSPSRLKVGPKSSQNCLKFISKLSQSFSQIVSKLSLFDHPAQYWTTTHSYLKSHPASPWESLESHFFWG